MADQVSATPTTAVVATTSSSGKGAAVSANSDPARATPTASTAADISFIARPKVSLSVLEAARPQLTVVIPTECTHTERSEADPNKESGKPVSGAPCARQELHRLWVDANMDTFGLMGASAGSKAVGDNPTAGPKPGSEPGATTAISAGGNQALTATDPVASPPGGAGATVVLPDGTKSVIRSTKMGLGSEQPKDLPLNHYDWAKTYYADLRVPMSFSRSFGMACYRTFTALCRWQEGRMSNKYGRPLPLLLFFAWEMLWLVNSLWVGVWAVACVVDGPWDRAARLTVAWCVLASANGFLCWLMFGWIKSRWGMLMSMVCYTVSLKATVAMINEHIVPVASNAYVKAMAESQVCELNLEFKSDEFASVLDGATPARRDERMREAAGGGGFYRDPRLSLTASYHGTPAIIDSVLNAVARRDPAQHEKLHYDECVEQCAGVKNVPIGSTERFTMAELTRGNAHIVHLLLLMASVCYNDCTCSKHVHATATECRQILADEAEEGF